MSGGPEAPADKRARARGICGDLSPHGTQCGLLGPHDGTHYDRQAECVWDEDGLHMHDGVDLRYSPGPVDILASLREFLRKLDSEPNRL